MIGNVTEGDKANVLKSIRGKQEFKLLCVRIFIPYGHGNEMQYPVTDMQIICYAIPRSPVHSWTIHDDQNRTSLPYRSLGKVSRRHSSRKMLRQRKEGAAKQGISFECWRWDDWKSFVQPVPHLNWPSSRQYSVKGLDSQLFCNRRWSE